MMAALSCVVDIGQEQPWYDAALADHNRATNEIGAVVEDRVG